MNRGAQQRERRIPPCRGIAAANAAAAAAAATEAAAAEASAAGDKQSRGCTASHDEAWRLHHLHTGEGCGATAQSLQFVMHR
jgi:hypothetical protein